jgi:CheY-like chemotaxis protein
MEAVGRLAGGVAHDFNNLLGVIIGYSDLLLDRVSPDDPDHHHVQEIKKAGSRAASLTRQLLAFSRKQVFQPKVLDLNAVVADLNKLLHRLIGEDIELVTALRPTLGTIKMDPGQLEQVLMNLVVNARDAMPKGGKLTIATANVDVDESYCRSHPAIQVGPHVVLAVSDTGIGMDAETQARIFEPFFTTKELGKGTGLGLSTVYGVVKQSEGYIWVYSEPGIGTTFKIYFPRVDEPVDVIGIGRPNSAQLRGTETILIAEDAEPLRKLTCTFLKSNGYRVLAAGSGAEAIKMAAEYLEPIHLLLTDVVMPRMSGPELANRLTAARPEMRVVYMSGYTDDAIVHYGVLEPGTFFIEKPFSRDVLLGKVRDALDQARAAPVISLEQPLSRS